MTSLPDATVVIDDAPSERCIEPKSLELCPWSFRDQGTFAEQLAVDIADEVVRAGAPTWVEVHGTQRARGGIVTECVARRAAAG